uniref:J domain-containing protein n=1 Tax=viral metagenome TaxID=1070528 RepID=A0A6C0H0Q9_9ZZZZ
MDLIQVYVKYNLYEILEISPTDSINTIKKKYKKLAIKFHPDKYLNSDELTEDEKKTLKDHFNLVNTAYDILSNENSKDLYNKARKEYLESGTAIDLKKQFNDFSFNYGDKDTSKKIFKNENEKLNEVNEKFAEEVRQNTQKNLNKVFEINRIDNFDELIKESSKESKKEYFNKFNNLFDEYRKKDNPHTEIIAWNQDNNNASLDNAFGIINIQEKNTSSFEEAFNLMGISHNDYKDSGLTLDEKMKEYENSYNKLKIPEPTKKEKLN